MLKNYLLHTLGFIIISFGIVGVIFSNLGATPIDAFNYFVYTLTPFSLGTVVIFTGLSVALLAFIFHPTKDMVISVLFLFMVGILVDGWKLLFELMPTEFYTNIIVRLLLATISLLMMAFGVSITITTGLASSPYERLMMVLNQKVHSIQYSKMIIEATFLIFAIIMGIITQKLFDQVHVFTILLVLFNGPLVGFFSNKINKRKNKGDEVYAT